MKTKSTGVICIFLILALAMGCSDESTTPEVEANEPEATLSDYMIVDTNQSTFYNASGVISSPDEGAAFNGQDAAYTGNQPSYSDNGDGTVTDNVTGLMWEAGFGKTEWPDAESYAAAATTGGHTDWRVPTTKELYSLIDFSGNQGSGLPDSPTPPADAIPFIDIDFFDFEYPSINRYIDAQYVASTAYVGLVMGGSAAFFGVNFADGRIKGYPQDGDPSGSEEGRWYIRLVRGSTVYGRNDFADNGDSTITDGATGLMWMLDDSGSESFSHLLDGYLHNDGTLNWEEALSFAENLEFADHTDWRLPNAKELHSIVDYTRAPDVTGTAAIDPIFNVTGITNEAGEADFPFYWSSTTFLPGSDAIIIQFGRSLGFMDGVYMDVHGAGGQRTDPKTGEPSYHGPQGDVTRVYNHARCVRGGAR